MVLRMRYESSAGRNEGIHLGPLWSELGRWCCRCW